jgi:predicted transcriptional regulator
MDVLLSIRPEFAFRILDGSKKYEYRRTPFRRTDIGKVLVYASSPTRGVVGEFRIECILAESPHVLWARTKEQSGITRQFFLDYFGNAEVAYAIKVASVKKYRRPLDLATHLGVSAPQSFRYVNAAPKLPLAECR